MRSTVLRAIGLFALAFAVRVLLVVLYPDPAYVDSYYYVNVARALAAGHGFSIDFIWTFVDVGGHLPAHPVLPIASNAHWMPLASVVQVPFIVVLGATAFASALPFALIGALAAPMVWLFAREAGCRPNVALGGAILTAVPAAVTPFMSQPDNFALFQVLVLAALWLGARALRGDAWAFAITGVFVALATLARNDGVLVGGALALVWVWSRIRFRRARAAGLEAPRPLPVWAAVVATLLFLAVMAPWEARQLAVFGSLSPSSSTGRILFIRSISELNSITGTPTLSYLLGQGIGPLLASRLTGFFEALVIFSVLVGGILLAPFIAAGAWLRRHSADFLPFLLYAGLLFAFSGLISAVHVPNGTFIHSGAALAPQSYLIALEAVVALVAWIARRRPSWNAEAAGRVFVGGVVAISLVGAIYFTANVHDSWATERNLDQAVGAALDAHGAAADDVVMSLDTGAIKYWTGHPGVVAPNDPIDTIQAVAQAYNVRWLYIERSDAVAALGPIIDGSGRPGWVGPPVWSVTGAAATIDAGLYPVCFSTADPRCVVLAAGGSGQ
ncbi:MAG TPA: glycosyltransferase family 39 protein [Candidatus Limnocylindrales bacterium]|nr:glycosyltransferase family 39 protein [Candidatus Limnocylindrales bacterium]